MRIFLTYFLHTIYLDYFDSIIMVYLSEQEKIFLLIIQDCRDRKRAILQWKELFNYLL